MNGIFIVDDEPGILNALCRLAVPKPADSGNSSGTSRERPSSHLPPHLAAGAKPISTLL